MNPSDESEAGEPRRWHRGGAIADINTPWVRLLGEHWRDDQGRALEYWRCERASSVIVLPEHRGHLLLPAASFRPGVDRLTLDFPGGRLPPEQAPAAVAPRLLQRELGAAPATVLSLQTLTPMPLDVDSSFSNQRLFGFVAHLDPDQPEPRKTCYRFARDRAGLTELLAQLRCLQCRALLMELLLSKSAFVLE